MKRYITFILLVALFAPLCQIDAKGGRNRDEWFKKIREYKHEFIANELGLTPEQQQKFFPIYDKMENALCAYRFEISTLRFINKFGPFYRFARYPKSIIGNPWRINSIHKATLGRRTI